jgi:hypothetical protein
MNLGQLILAIITANLIWWILEVFILDHFENWFNKK